jgi:hypothetical protein
MASGKQQLAELQRHQQALLERLRAATARLNPSAAESADGEPPRTVADIQRRQQALLKRLLERRESMLRRGKVISYDASRTMSGRRENVRRITNLGCRVVRAREHRPKRRVAASPRRTRAPGSKEPHEPELALAGARR